MRSARDDQDAEPDWVQAHEEAQQRRALADDEAALQARLRAVREHAPPAPSRPPKRARTDSADVPDDSFLIGDYDEQRGSAPPRPSTDVVVSDDVRAMMQAWDASCHTEGTEAPETTPKIFFVSRTHSQLAQLVRELQKTPFATADEPVRSISLGSRRQMCIHEGVQRLAASSGTDAMNERCLELMESSSKRCPYLPAPDAVARALQQAYSDQALARVHDMEDLVQLGRQMKVCPYYGARHSARQAHLVTMPYPLLLQRDARASLQLSLRDSVILIDEAHNLIDTILATYSTSISASELAQARAQVDMYLARFSMRLKGSNEEHVRTLQVLLRALDSYMAHAAQGGTGVTARSTPAFLTELGMAVEQINVRRAPYAARPPRPLAQGHAHRPQGAPPHSLRSAATRTSTGRRTGQRPRRPPRRTRCMRSRRSCSRSVTVRCTAGSSCASSTRRRGSSTFCCTPTTRSSRSSTRRAP